MRPAGGGLYLVSTGKAEQERLQQTLYGAASPADVEARWHEALARISSARAIILGVPSDVGAGFRRGANLGPQALRAGLLDAIPAWPSRATELGIVDIGDVFVVPQLLHDEMLSDAQLRRSREALYPSLPEAVRATLPVSPLSIAERALDLVFALNPHVAPIVLGGDHSTAWPAAAALARARKDRWGIVQPDAHTDLLEHRLGVPICFATWSWHANELLGRDGRMVQVGTRATRHERGHWESTLGVRQFWAEECRRDPEGSIDAVIAHLKERKVSGVYFSNDIDGTDDAYAIATGTPEPDGLDPEWLVALIRRLGQEIGVIGGDVMEVAPPLGEHAGSVRTVSLAVRYLRETLAAILRAEV